VRFLLVRKRASCGYDNTAQRHFGGGDTEAATNRGVEKRHRLRFRSTSRFCGDELSVLGRVGAPSRGLGRVHSNS
jgi:hypothetical protein